MCLKCEIDHSHNTFWFCLTAFENTETITTAVVYLHTRFLSSPNELANITEIF